jgi:AbiV family abortive infection protein
MRACVDHARDLLDVAKVAQATGKPHIAYHLATLALEELGRRELIAVESISTQRPVPPAWPAKHTQDHVQKLFWAFFGANFLGRQLTKEALEADPK